MTARLGRPKSPNAMTERLTIRLDKNTKDILEQYCKENNVDKAEAVRRGIQCLPIKK